MLQTEETDPDPSPEETLTNRVRRERFFYGLLHNETSKIIQRRLQWVGVPMVVLPIRARVQGEGPSPASP